MRILIVDDSPDDQLLLRTILKKAGFTSLFFADSAFAAFDLLTEADTDPPVDIILMDVLMPRMDGLEALGRIKANPPWAQIPVVMVTGHRESRDLAAAFAAGAVDYITKPINRVELLARLHSVIALEEVTRKLRRSEQYFRVMASSLAEGLATLDRQGRVRFLNPSGEDLLRCNPEQSEGGKLFFDCLPDPQVKEAFQSILEGQRFKVSGETLLQPPHGPPVDVAYTAAPLQEGEHGGEVTGLVVTFQDITRRKEAEERLRLGARVMETSNEGIIITDARARILEVNPAFTYITGYSREEVLHQSPGMLRSERTDTHFYQEMWRSLREHDRWQGEIWNRRKSGEVYPEWLSISAIRDTSGHITHYVGIFTDITTRKLAEQRLEQLAHYDILTGLPNRMLLMDRLRQALAKARRDQTTVALLFLDLDNFKPINDAYGHEAGDAVLRTVGRRLSGTVRQSDTVARLGGDEFLILLQDVQEVTDVEAVAGKVIHLLSQPIRMDQHTFRIGCSIGIAFFPRDAQDPDTLINLADSAMYQAKGGGRNRYCVFPVPPVDEVRGASD